MQNGTYLLNNHILNSKYKAIAYNGYIKLYSTNGKFIKYITEETINNHYTITKKITPNRSYNIAYYVNVKIKEVLTYNSSYPFVKNKIEQLKYTFKPGKLIPIRTDQLF